MADIIVTLSRYQDLLDETDAWMLDMDTTNDSHTHVTFCSSRVKDLLEAVTGELLREVLLTRTGIYEGLESLQYKIRFLIDIQMAVLDAYHGRLLQSVEAFESISFRNSHVLPGVYVEDAHLVTGVAGAERLCRVYGSAACLEEAMREWNEHLVL